MLGLIRTARWFVARTQDFDGWTLFFVTQFDGSLPKYFDDFVLNGKENLLKVWGQCVGCPDGPDATAADVVEYIARGQIKTLACYDFVPEPEQQPDLQGADWYEKAQKFQRAVAKGDGNLEAKVDAYLKELAEPSPEPAQRRGHRYRRGAPVAVRGRRRAPVALTVAAVPAHTRLTRTGRLWRPVDS